MQARPESFFVWANAPQRTGAYQESAGRWEVLRRAFPEHQAGWTRGANALVQAGDHQAAEALLEASRKAFPTHPAPALESANLELKRGDFERAEAYLIPLRRQHAGNLEVWLMSGRVGIADGRIEDGEAFFKRGVETVRGRPAPWIEWAKSLVDAGKADLAVERLRQALEHFPDHASVHKVMADTFRSQGRRAEARNTLLRARYGADFFPAGMGHKAVARKDGVRWTLGLIWTRAILGLRSEVHRNYLGYAWWIIEPLMHVVTYYLVFGVLLHRGGEGFVVFLLAGLIPWIWFVKAVSGSSASVLGGQNLMLQTGIPPVVFPLTTVLRVSLKQAPVLLVLIAFLATQVPVSTAWCWLLLLVAVQAVFMTAVGMVLAAIVPFVRDLTHLVATGLTFWMFLSGIFYDYRTIPEDYRGWFLMNPVAQLIKAYRQVLLESMPPDLLPMVCLSAVSVLVVAGMAWMFRAMRYTYPRIVLE